MQAGQFWIEKLTTLEEAERIVGFLLSDVSFDAAALMAEMFGALEQLRARYLVAYTCDLPSYRRIQELFTQSGFSLIGRCPDYYYEGEDRLIYYLKLV